jgi:PGF-CTERM protein
MTTTGERARAIILTLLMLVSVMGGSFAFGGVAATDESTAKLDSNVESGQLSGTAQIDVNSSDLEENGTETDPYLINNSSELQAIEDDLDAHYELAADIDASNTTRWNDGQGFDPIGNASTPFNGSFDGANHTITGLTIDRPETFDTGLFGAVEDGGTVKRVHLRNADITGDLRSGLLAGGVSSGGVVYSSSASGNVTGRSNVGGAVGDVNGGTVENVSATVDVEGEDSVGGLAGSVRGSGLVESSDTQSSVSGEESVGGFTGSISTSVAVVRDSTADTTVNGTTDVGGFVGRIEAGTIERSSASGNVTAPGRLGGFAGVVTTGPNDRRGEVVDSYTAASVETEADEQDVGGFVGLLRNGKVTTSYAVGAITGPATQPGGLVGNSTDGTVIDAYWDRNTTGQSTSAGDGTGLTTAEMQGTAAASNMSGFDFESTWTTTESYPVLRSSSESDGQDQDTTSDTDSGAVINVTESSVSPNTVEAGVQKEYEVTVVAEDVPSKRGEVDVRFEDFKMSPVTDDEDATIDFTEANVSDDGTLTVSGAVNATAPSSLGDFDANVTDLRVEGDNDEDEYLIADASITIDEITVTSNILVNASGDGDYESIQNGVNNATDGDLVEVRPGTYAESVDVDKNITLVAPDGANITNTSAVSGEYGLNIFGPTAPKIGGFRLVGWKQGVEARQSEGDWFLGDSLIVGGEYGIVAAGTDNNWTVSYVKVDGVASSGIVASESSGNWTVEESLINSTVTGINASDSSGNWTVRDTRVERTQDGIVVARGSGAWAIERSYITDAAASGVEVRKATGDWTIRYSAIVDTSQGVVATNTTGAWVIRWSAVVDSTDLAIDAQGAETEGNATLNWWGPDGPVDSDFAGNVSYADPLQAPPTFIIGTLSAESGASLAGDTVAAYTETADGDINAFEADIDENGEFGIETERPGVVHTVVYADDDVRTLDGVPDLYAIGKTIPPEQVEQTLPQAHNVSIRVTDQYGNPIENADVAIQHQNGDAVVQEGESDATNDSGYVSAEGSTTLEFVGNLTVEAGFNGVNNSTNVEVAGDREITVELSGATVNGTINTSSGSPVGDSVGVFTQADDGNIEGIDTTVGDNSQFEIGGLSADQDYMLAFGDNETGETPNGVPDLYAIQSVSPSTADENIDVGEIAIPEAHNVSIRVEDQNGDPIEGADVAIRHDNGDAFVLDGKRNATNETGYLVSDGEASLELAGNVTVGAEYRGVNNTTNVADVSGDREITVRLTRPDVTGSLSAANGESLKDDFVGIYRFDDEGDIEVINTTVDADGNFTISGGSAEYGYTLVFADTNSTDSPNGVPDLYAIQRVTPPADVGDIELPKAQNVTIRVTDQSGTPIEGAYVRVEHTNNGTFIAEDADDATNETGYLSINGTTSFEFTGNLSIFADFNGVNNRTDVTISDEDQDVTIELPRVEVNGTVTNATGSVVQDGTVAYDGAEEQGETFEVEDGLDADGRYRMEILPAAYQIQFDQQANQSPIDGVPDVYAADYDFINEPTENNISLPEAHQLRVRVENETGPIGGARVEITHRNNGSEASVETQTDGTGNVTLGGTRGLEVNGNVELELESDRYVAATEEFVTEDEFIVLEAKEKVNVTGNVTAPDGTELTDWQVVAYPSQSDGVVSDQSELSGEGEYELALAANTTYDLGFRQVDEQTETDFPKDAIPDVEVLTQFDTGTEDESLATQQLGIGHQFDITVTNPANEPVPDANVYVSSVDPENDSRVGIGGETNEDGAVDIYGAEEPGVEVNGTVEVYVDPPGTDLQDESARFTVTADGTVNITLDRNVSVSGSVDYADGDDASGYTMELFGDGGDYRLTNETGHFELYPEPNRFYALAFKQTDWEGGKEDFPKDGRPDLHTFGAIEVENEDRDAGDLTLPSAHLVNITVENTRGEPVSDAVVDLNAYSGPASSHHPGTTNDGGEVILNGSSSPGIEVNGTLRIGVRETDEYAWNATRIDVDEDRDVTLVVRDRVNVTGQLTTNQSGDPLTDFDILVDRSQSGFPTGKTNDTGWFTVGVGANQSHSLTVEQRDPETGAIAPRDGVTDFYELPIVDVDADDRNLGEQTVPNASGVLNVSVTNESGTPVENALVTIIPNQSGRSDVESARLGSLTDEQGYFTVGDRRGIEAAGEYIIRVERPPNADQYVDESHVREVNVTGDETVEVMLNETATAGVSPEPFIIAPSDDTYDPTSPFTVGTGHNATGVIDDGDVAIRLINVTDGNNTEVALNDSVPVAGDVNTTIPAGSLSGNVTIRTQLYNNSSKQAVANDTVGLTAVQPEATIEDVSVGAGDSSLQTTVNFFGDIDGANVFVDVKDSSGDSLLSAPSPVEVNLTQRGEPIDIGLTRAVEDETISVVVRETRSSDAELSVESVEVQSTEDSGGDDNNDSGDSSGGDSDTTPPTVRVDAPGTVNVSEQFTVNASASTDSGSGIANYTFAVPNQPNTTQSTPQFETNFSETGTQSITVTVTDDAGNQNSTTIAVEVVQSTDGGDGGGGDDGDSTTATETETSSQAPGFGPVVTLAALLSAALLALRRRT